MDLDGTLLTYDGWKGDAHYGTPIPGMKEVLQRLKDLDWIIVIWSTRGSKGSMRKHLLKHAISFDYINKNPHGPPGASPKIFADVYLDDRALRFEGETERLVEKILECATPWFEKEK